MKFLFIDDYHVHFCEGLRHTFHKLNKYTDGPVCELTGPRGGPIFSAGAFERDPQKDEFILWYRSSTPGRSVYKDPDFGFTCQARSTDGLHWEKPSLGIYEYEGSRDNNICQVGYLFSGRTSDPHSDYSGCILRDDLDPDPAARYKMTIYRYHRGTDPVDNKPLKMRADVDAPSGLYLSQSPDGIHWPKYERLLFLLADGFGDAVSWMLDTLRRRYVIFGKTLDKHPDGTPIRLRYQTYGSNWNDWAAPWPILTTGPHDQPDDQVYQNHAFVYGDMYVGFARMLHPDYTATMQLIFSRDCELWHRPAEGLDVLPLGRGTEWDSGMIAMWTSPPIRVKDQLYFYYTATPQRHSPAPQREIPEKDQRPSGPCLATLRVDGFVSLDAQDEGRVVTRPFELCNPALLVNVDATHGRCRAGLLDQVGRPYPGFAVEDCDPVTDDVIDHPLTWKGRTPEPLMCRPMHLDIRLDHASLYAITGGFATLAEAVAERKFCTPSASAISTVRSSPPASDRNP